MILIDPRNGYLSSSSQTPTIIGVVLLVAFVTRRREPLEPSSETEFAGDRRERA